MKKIALIFTVVLGFSLSTFASGGIFQRGYEAQEEANNRSGYFNYYDSFRDGDDDPLFPNLPGHGTDDNGNAPLAGGALLLIGFGAAYALKKKNK